MKSITQLDLLRRIGGKKRFEIALRLSAITREMALVNIKSQNPRADNKKLNSLLLQRYVAG